jgi:site-specific DNA recombinase
MNRKHQTKKPAEKRRVAAYVRVSTTRQKMEGDSLEAQQNAINRYLEYRSGPKIETVKFFIEGGKSAKDQNRPQLQKLKAEILKGEIDTVICVKLDRITRSVLDFADLWEFFEQHNVEFISLNESVDSSTPMGEAMMLIIMVFAQLERKVTGERTRATMLDRASRGLSNGGCKYGYIADPNERGRLIPDPEWSTIIKENFFDAVERLGSAGAVQREITEKWKITAPKRKTRSGNIMGGEPFTKQQVMRILRNHLYIGQTTWGNVVAENSHEPLITRQQFERVQTLLNKTTTHRSNRKKSRGRGYTLRGLVRCACGAAMTPKSATGRNETFHYYECTQKNHLGRAVCDARGIPAEPLEEAVAARVAEIGTSEEARIQIITEALKLVDANAQETEKESEKVRQRLTTVKSEIGKLVAVLKNAESQVFESIREEMTRLESEKRELEAKLRELQESKTPLDNVTALAKTFIQNWQGLGELLRATTGDERRTLLEQFVEVIQIAPSAEDAKKGTYVMRLFPEAVSVRPTKDGNSQEETQRTGDSPMLSGSSPVLNVGELAPRGVLNSIQALLIGEPYSSIGYVEQPLLQSSPGMAFQTSNRRRWRHRKKSAIP